VFPDTVGTITVSSVNTFHNPPILPHENFLHTRLASFSCIPPGGERKSKLVVPIAMF